MKTELFAIKAQKVNNSVPKLRHFFFPAHIIKLCFSWFLSFSLFLWVSCDNLRCFFQWQGQTSVYLLTRAKTTEKHLFCTVSQYFFSLCAVVRVTLSAHVVHQPLLLFQKELTMFACGKKAKKNSFHSDVTENIRTRLFLSEIPKSQISNIFEIIEIKSQKSDSKPRTFCFLSHIKKVWNPVFWKFGPFLRLDVNIMIVFRSRNALSRANSCCAICPNFQWFSLITAYFPLLTWRDIFFSSSHGKVFRFSWKLFFVA